MKTRLSAIQKAWKLKRFLNSRNLDEVLKAVNDLVKIYEDHEMQIKLKCESKDFANVENVDFNIWAYTQRDKIQALYFDLKSRFHDLHWDQFGFNAYE